MSSAANDTVRLAYLNAMGVAVYSSRRSLPGAATSRRISCVPAALTVPAPSPSAPAAPREQTQAERLPSEQFDRPAVHQKTPPREPEREVRVQSAAEAFTLAFLIAGDVLWLEDLGGAPLAREQVALVRGMCLACGAAAGSPKVLQFNWPMHSNPQFDQGPQAAGAALQAFVERVLAEQKCHRLAVLGADAWRRIEGQALTVPILRLPSTRMMLSEPSRKRDAWRVLRETLK